MKRRPVISILIGSESLWAVKPAGALENLSGHTGGSHYYREYSSLFSPTERQWHGDSGGDHRRLEDFLFPMV